ncbi:MAG: recombinase family protein [Firmicutes bacterium]|nr:recombinase family protein [Bacillota bacterium]
MPTAAKKLTVIPAKKNILTENTINSYQRLRVAAYARVSTDSEEQQGSYEAQCNYYENYIRQNPEWEYVRVYADEGITGTSAKKRDGFNEMINDAMDGKIDFIVTKAISRFARNTLDTLTYVRQLKDKGIGVYFENQNINTLDSKGEVLLTILAALAQDEIRCLSENVAWGKRKRYADGEVFIPISRFLGFDKDGDGNIVINEDEAKTVRLIFKLFIEGKTEGAIKRYLENKGILAPGGGQKWYTRTITSMLQNEKYQGDALLQKGYVADFLSKKVVKNNGVLPQYYVENSHPAIVSSDVFKLAQAEFARRRQVRTNNRICTDSPFGGRIVCSECSGFFGRKVWHSGSKYERYIWRCNDKYKSKGNKSCDLPHLNEEDIKSAFIIAFNQIFDCKDEVVNTLEAVINETLSKNKTETAIKKLYDELEIIHLKTKALIDRNSKTAMNQEEYRCQYDALSEKYKTAIAEIESLENKENEVAARKIRCGEFINVLKSQENALSAFDEPLWNLLIESVIIHKKNFKFIFRTGQTVNVAL